MGKRMGHLIESWFGQPFQAGWAQYMKADQEESFSLLQDAYW